MAVQIIDNIPNDPNTGIARKIYVFKKLLEDDVDQINAITKCIYFKPDGSMFPTSKMAPLEKILPITNNDFVDIRNGQLIPGYHTEEDSNPDTKNPYAVPQLYFINSLCLDDLIAFGFPVNSKTPIKILVDDLVEQNVRSAVTRGIYD
jgi:hypothetical protein